MMRAITALLFTAFLVSGCASKFEADVTRFHQLPAPGGESVAIVARDKELERSIEFERYAALIRERLQAEGFTQPADGTAPAIIAEMDFGVSEGRSALRDERGPVSVGVGVGGGSRSGIGVGMSTGINLGSRGASDATFVRRFTLTLTRASDGQRLFEGRVVSEGDRPDLARVMPLMIDAMFENFPGVSGETRSISRELPR